MRAPGNMSATEANHLRVQLRLLTLWRLCLICGGLLGGCLLVVSWLRPEYGYVKWFFAAGVSGVILALTAAEFGSAGLVRAVQNAQPSANSEWIAAMLVAMRYWLVRELAVEKMVVAVASLDAGEALRVKPRLWRRLYKHVASGLPARRAVVFDVALLTGDPKAMPYLHRILRSRDLPTEMRPDLESRMAEFEHRVTRGSHR